MKGKKEKGGYGYIGHRKKVYLLQSFLYVLIGIIIFLGGFLAFKRDAKNVCTMLAILMVLPFAKSMVEFVVLFPFHSPSKEAFERVKKMDLDGMELYSDLVITSSEKVMNLDFLVEGKGTVIGLAGKKGQDVRYIDEYLTKGIRNWGADYNVKILGDEKKFMSALENIKPHEVTDIERKHVVSYIKSLIV